MRYDVLPRRPAVKWVASMTDGERVGSENTSGNTSEGRKDLVERDLVTSPRAAAGFWQAVFAVIR